MRARLLMALLLATPLAARAEDAPRLDFKGVLSLEGAVDDNPTRQPLGSGAGTSSDVLAYLFGSGNADLRLGRHLLHGEAEAGGKLFGGEHTEDLVALRLLGSYRLLVSRDLVLSAEATYKDKVQRGAARLDLDEALAALCTPPEGVNRATYRCFTRDYRAGTASLAGDLRLGERLALRVSAGGGAFEYKPHPWFTYLGPQGSAALRLRVSKAVSTSAFAGYGLRFYPFSPTFLLVPSAPGRQTAVLGSERRVEQLVSGGLTASWHGPLLLGATWILAASFNNGDAMDVVRNRFELSAALRLGARTTLLASGALQLAHWPQGNVLRQLLLIGDESEQQNSVALKLSHRAGDRVALVVKFQAHANELATQTQDALPFRRQVFQTGVEASF